MLVYPIYLQQCPNFLGGRLSDLCCFITVHNETVHWKSNNPERHDSVNIRTAVMRKPVSGVNSHIHYTKSQWMGTYSATNLEMPSEGAWECTLSVRGGGWGRRVGRGRGIQRFWKILHTVLVSECQNTLDQRSKRSKNTPLSHLTFIVLLNRQICIQKMCWFPQKNASRVCPLTERDRFVHQRVILGSCHPEPDLSAQSLTRHQIS